MIQIKLTESIKDKHKKYWQEKILPNLIKESVTPDLEKVLEYKNNHNIVTKLVFENNHKNFLKYIANNWERFAIGDVSTLKELQKDLNDKFPLIISLILNQQSKDRKGNETNKDPKDNTNKKELYYKDKLLDIFGYSKFEVIDLYEYIKKYCINKVRVKDAKENTFINIKSETINELKSYRLTLPDIDKYFQECNDTEAFKTKLAELTTSNKNLMIDSDILYEHLLIISNNKLQSPRRATKASKEKMIDFLIQTFPEHTDDIKKNLQSNMLEDELKKGFKKLKYVDVTMLNFTYLKDIFSDSWNPYLFVIESGLRVCPYCNRQYITPIYSDNGKVRGDLDHFLPKFKYPYFSMSIYNLVPVCKFCNQSLKGTTEFDFDDINPYETSLNDYFKFKVDTNSKIINIEPCEKKNSLNKHLNTFKIKSLYNYHYNHVDELIKKRYIYTDDYIKNLYKAYDDYFKNEDELKQLIVGYLIDKNEINNESLSKLRRDIAIQLKFIHDDEKLNQIDKLKNVLEKL